MPPKTPRFDPYQRLFYRLYEVILLLHNLNRTQGSHLVRHHDASDIVATRRRFLSNLAFLCDYKKGGDSTTAIAIEDTAEHYKFWIAMNRKPSQDKDVVLHTRTVLSLLKRASKLPVEETGELEMAILRISIKLATERISKEAKLLSASVQRCIMLLEETNHSAGKLPARTLHQTLYYDGNTDNLPSLLRTKAGKVARAIQVQKGSQLPRYVRLNLGPTP